MTVLFYTHSGSGGKDRGEEISHLILKDTLGRKEQGEKKNAFGTEVRCALPLIFCTLGLPFVIYARRGRMDGGGEGTVEEKSPQIINNNSGLAIDSFSWDFPGEPISASC